MADNVIPLTEPAKLAAQGQKIIAEGYPVFPVMADKRPLTAGVLDCITEPSKEALAGQQGFYLYTRDPDDVLAMANLPGCAGWAVPTGMISGIVVIDCDSYKDDFGTEAMDFQGVLSEAATRVHGTLRKGTHYVFTIKEPVGSSVPLKGIDVKGDGGYVVWPPTAGYTFHNRKKPKPLPAEILDHLARAKQARQKLTVDEMLAEIMAGSSWHDNTRDIVMKLRKQGTEIEVAVQRCLSAMELAVKMKQRGQSRLDEMLAKDIPGIVKWLSRVDQDVDEALDDALAAMEAQPDPFGDAGVSDDQDAPASHHWAHKMPDEALDADIIEDMIDRSGVTVVYGEPGAGKSFILLDMAAAVARGTSWFGRYTRQGPVLYCAAEGARGFRNRARAYMKHHGLDELDIVIYDGPVNLAQQSIVKNKELVAALAEARWSMIVFDTLQATTAGVSLNDAEIWGDVMTNVRALTRVYGCNVAFAHHANKAVGDVYGSVFIKAGADHIFKVEGAEGVHTIAAIKQKDYETHGQFWAFGLETVALGVQRVRPDGSTAAINSAVVVPASNTKLTTDDLGEMIGSAVLMEVGKSNVQRHEGKVARCTLEYVLKSDVMCSELFMKMVDEYYGRGYEELNNRQKADVWKSLKDHQYLKPELGKGGKRIWLLEGWDVV